MTAEAPVMPAANYQCLNLFLDRHSSDPEVQGLKAVLGKNLEAAAGREQLDEVIAIYNQALPVIEKTLWSAAIDDAALSGYQQTCRELEHLIALRGNDRRYSFMIVIPVADRPQHLAQCLNSLLTLCRLFHYGGMREDGCYAKVSVIVADDSSDAGNVTQIRNSCREFSAQGLRTEYFGAAEQQDLLRQTPQYRSGRLRRILGDLPGTGGAEAFSHKGAAITRNITYLKLRRVLAERGNDRLLFYFIDSDQQFNVVAPAYSARQNLYAINYFHHLNEIFTTPGVAVLTGKVVGAPPVSPAVMAGHFQDDVIGFLKTLDALLPEQPCCFHGSVAHRENSASYHDMANLFGFSNSDETFRYHCTLTGAHSLRDCMRDFAGKLNGFFHGEHPTRATRFNYAGALSATTPARTIYTGNYIFRPDGLKYFIPFANLQLRMAGPVLGRILRSELKHAFVSANLPMLHNRTLEVSGRSEFRPGVKVRSNRVNLSGEFERQYYGDVMLFTVEKLAAEGYPRKAFSAAEIMATIEATDNQLRAQYAAIHAHILEQLALLKTTFGNAGSWWHSAAGLEDAVAEFAAFISNIEHNFGAHSACYALLESGAEHRQRLQQIAAAAGAYLDDMDAWQEAIA